MTQETLQQLNKLRDAAGNWLSDHRYQNAIACYEEALDLSILLDDEKGLEASAEICHELGKLHFDQGHRREAGQFYKQALATYLRLHPRKNHKDVASSYFILGRFFEQIWKVDLAREHYTESHAIMRTVLGESHPHVRAIGLQIDRFEKNVAPFARDKSEAV